MNLAKGVRSFSPGKRVYVARDITQILRNISVNSSKGHLESG